MRPSERIAAYERTTGWKDTLHLGPGGVILGVWVMGNNYTVKSGFYGGFPSGYLKRVKALFPEKVPTLHLFSGMVDVDSFPGDTVDVNSLLDPTYIDNAETLLNVPLETYKLVLADPPYSIEDTEHYGTPMVNRNKVMKALERLPEGAFVVWLDQVLPMYRKDVWSVCAHIGMVKSTNHRFRVVTIFERKGGDPFEGL